MRKKEELVREFAKTKPDPASAQDPFVAETRKYLQQRLLFEVLLDVREALGRLSVEKVKAEAAESLKHAQEFGMGELEEV